MTIRWGILGAARFAQNHMAPAIHAAKGADFAALATGSPDKAAAFRAFAPHLKVFNSYAALLADPLIDAVYIPLPNHLHVEWTIKALAAGKHVLCEKPIALHARDFDRLEAARNASGKHVAEAFMVVHHPQLIRARALVQGGEIGQVKHVDAVFTYDNSGDPQNIRNSADTGGGGLPDIGVYTFGAARFVTGQDCTRVTHATIQYENGVDVFAQVAAELGNIAYAAVVSMRMFPRQEITFHGGKGILRLTCPFNAGVHDIAKLRLETDVGHVVTERWPTENQYIRQVEAFGDTIKNGAEFACPLSFSRGTQEMMDMVFAACPPPAKGGHD